MAEDQDIEQQDPPTKLGVKEFAAKIKAKYPDYASIDDNTLVQKIITKYPEYKEQVDFSQKKNSLPTSSIVATPSQRQSVSAAPSTAFDPATFMRQSRAATLEKPVQDNTTSVHVNQTKQAIDTQLHGAERKAAKQKIKEEAITNATEKYLKNKGINAPVGSATFNQQRAKTQAMVDNGDAHVAQDNDGTPGLKRVTGFLENIVNGWNEATKGADEANEFTNNMTSQQRVEYLKKHEVKKPDEFIGERESLLGSTGHFLGGAGPFLGKAAVGAGIGAVSIAAAPESMGASLAGLPTAMGFILTAPDMANQGAQAEIIRRYQILKNQNPEMDDVTAMEEAGNGALSGGIGGILTNAALMGTGLKTPLSMEAKTVIGKTAQQILKSGAHMGAISGGVTAGQQLEGELEGIHTSTKDKINATVESFKENATVGAMLTTLMHGVPKVMESAIKFALKDTKPQEIRNVLQANENIGTVPEGTTQKVMTDLSEYNNALSKTVDGLTPESKASVAGLIQAKNKLVEEAKTKDNSAKPIYKEKIDAIDRQISEIQKTNEPFKSEIDETTGEVYDKPAPKISELTNKDVIFEGQRGRLRTDEENNVLFDNGTKETLLGKTTDENFNNSTDHGITEVPKVEVKGDKVKIDNDNFEIVSFNKDNDGNLVSVSLKNDQGRVITKRDKELALDVAIAKNNHDFESRPEPKDYQEHKQAVDTHFREEHGQKASEIIDSMPDEVADTFAAMDNKIEALAPRETQEMVIRASEWADAAKQKIQEGTDSPKEKADAIKMLDKFDKDLNKYYGKLEKQRKSQANADVKREQAESLGGAKQKAKREKARQLEIEAVEQENLATTTESRNRTYKRVNEIDDLTDAQGIALQYFAGGNKVDAGEMAGEFTGKRKSAMNRTGKTSDADGNTLFEKNGRTVDGVAHSLWDNLPEHLRESVTTQDIRNSLIDVMGSHESRFEAAKEFIEKYHPEFVEAKHNREMAEQWAEYEKQFEKEREAELEWLKEQSNEQKEIEETPEYIEQIIKKYESEATKADVEQPVSTSKGESTETLSPKKSAEPERDNLQRAAEDKPEPAKREQQSDKNESVKAGDFLRNFADIVDKGKISKLGGFKSSTGFDAVWDGSLTVVSKVLRESANLTDAVQAGLNHIKQTDWYKNLNNKKEFDEKYVAHLEGEYGKFVKESDIKPAEKEMIGITHEKTTEIADEFGFAGYEKNPETIAAWDKEATDKIKNGYNIGELVNKMENDYQPDKVEQRIMAKYIATLKDKVNNDPSDANISELKKVIELSDIVGGREVAKSLVARKGLQPVDNSLADYFIREMESSHVDKLTDKQKATAKSEFENIEKANKALQEKISKLEEENSRIKAAQSLSHERKISKQVRKTSEEFSNERKAIVSDIREKLKKIRQEQNVVVVPYAKELFAIAPDVMKIVKSLVEEGVVNLADVVERVHATLKDDIKELTEKDVHDIIAGEYNAPKKTRNEIMAAIVNLKQEAKALNEFEALEKGVVPVKESLKVERNRKIAELKKKISEHDLTRIGRKKENIKSQIADLEKQISTGNFEKPVPKRPIKLDEEGKELLDRLVKLKQDREIRLLKEEYNARSRYEIARDHVLEVLNVPRAVMASMDYSAPLRQAVVATISNPGLAAKAGKRMFEASFSQKNFDRWFFELKENPRYELMGLTKLSITDPHSPFLVAREEAYMSNLAEKIPLVGKLIKGSERAYVMYLNKMRADLFNKFADRFEEQGKTYENNKALYDKMADYVNNQTGRGNLGKAEDFAPVLNAVLFSPRLIASRVNLLNPVYFAKLPKELKVTYLKDMGRFVGFGLTVLALSQYANNDDDVTVEPDPRSSDFSKIKFGNTRWDIWGGFQQYVRVVSQFATGQRKSTNTKEIQELNGKGPFGTDRVDILASFLRGKVSPVVSTSINLLSGRNAFGQESTLGSEAKNILFPLTFSGAKEAFDDGGVKSLFLTGIPSIFGVGTQTYESKPKKSKETVIPYSSFK